MTRRIEAATAKGWNPLTVLHDGVGKARVAWRRGSRIVVGTGSLVELTAAGPTRLHDIKQQAATLWPALEVKRGVGVPPNAGPFLVGGFSFQDRAPDPPWKGWPCAWFFLPERMVLWSDEGVYETVVTGPNVKARPAPKDPSPLPPREPEFVDQAGWAKGVQGALDAIGMMRVEKLVLARGAKAQGAAPEDVLRLLWDQQGLNIFFVDRGEGPAWLGASPETLVRLSGTRVETHALAGSVVPPAKPSEKEQREHDLVVEDIRVQLSDLGVHLDRPEPMRTRSVGNLQHLETPISGRIVRGLHLLDVAGALHPTPAVGGAPRLPAQRMINRLERLDRGWYSGGVGWFDALGQGEISVGLRGALVSPEESIVYAGAGIVKGSVATAEWEETERKMQPMRDALAGKAPPPPPPAPVAAGPARPPSPLPPRKGE